METTTTKKSFFEELLERRFFQFFGTYLGICFALLQFGEFLENRFHLGNSIVEKLLIFMVLLLPAVVVFIYNHGRKGNDTWTKFEKLFIPINVVVALCAAVVFGNFSSSGPINKEVSIITEEGDTLSMLVPTIDQSKRVAIFPFEKQKAAKPNEWEGVAASILSDLDLEQDMHFIGINAIGMKDDYEAYGNRWLEPIPFATKLKIAQDNYSDYFLTGAYEEIGGGKLMLDVKLIDCNNGDTFYENRIESADIYDGIDVLSRDLRNQLILPEARAALDQVIDLPARDLITGDRKALENYTKAIISFHQNLDNPMAAMPLIQDAYEIDPSCAECYSVAGILYNSIGNKQKEIENFSKALAHSEILPERQKMDIRNNVYGSKGQFDKLRTLLKNWIELYPADYKPYARLMSFSENTLQYDDAIEMGKKALENGHKGPALSTLARLSMQQDDIEASERYYKMFEKAYPHKAKESTILADIHQRKGNFRAALNHLEQMSILSPSDISLYMRIADNEQKLGLFDNASQTYQSSFTYSKSIRDTLEIMAAQEGLMTRLGKINDAISNHKKRFELTRKIAPPMSVDFGQFQVINQYVLANRHSEMIAILEELRTKYAQVPFVNCLTYYLQYAMLEDQENFLPIYNDCKETMVQISGENFVYNMDGMKDYMFEDFESAASNYQTYIDSSGVNLDEINSLLCNMYRKSKQFDKAESIINEILVRDPFQPSFLLEKAKLEHDLGNNEKSKSNLEKALDIWSESDETYESYREALELKGELNI